MEVNSKKILEAQIRECFGRVVYTHKTQEKCADIILCRNKCYKVLQITLSAITTSGLVVIVVSDNTLVEILSAILSAMLLFVNLYLKNYDLGKIAQKHSEAAASLWDTRESYLSLLTDMRVGSIDVEQIQHRRDALQAKLSSIYKGAPRTISKAYVNASKALKKNEEMTFSNDEINKFLPEDLHVN